MEQMGLIDRLVEAKRQIGAVQKRERNTQGAGFNFRGVDTVVNAVSPVFNELGIVVMPRVLEVPETEQISYGSKGTAGFRTRVLVAYTFYAGDESLECVVAAEAIDSGDKSTAKAMSVAFRTALLQALTLPTDETDPDHSTYEVNRERKDITELRAALAAISDDSTVRAEIVKTALGRNDVKGITDLSPLDVATVTSHIQERQQA